jgi:hypothetical protein
MGWETCLARVRNNSRWFSSKKDGKGSSIVKDKNVHKVGKDREGVKDGIINVNPLLYVNGGDDLKSIPYFSNLFCFNSNNHPELLVPASFKMNISYFKTEERERVVRVLDRISNDALFLLIILTNLQDLMHSSGVGSKYFLNMIAPVLVKAIKKVSLSLIKVGLNQKVVDECYKGSFNILVNKITDPISPPGFYNLDLSEPVNAVYLDLYKNLVTRLHGGLDNSTPEGYPNMMECCWRYAQFYCFIKYNHFFIKMFGSVD